MNTGGVSAGRCRLRVRAAGRYRKGAAGGVLVARNIEIDRNGANRMTTASGQALGGADGGDRLSPEARDPSPRAAARRARRHRHHWVVRVTHWVNVFALGLMITTGLRIFNAFPAFARKGESFCCYPFAGKPIPAALTFGGWLAGARNYHFAAMWLLFVNGLVYVTFIYLHGEWRDLVPRRGDIRDSWEMIKFYLFARPDHPHQGKHNALQKSAYFAMPIFGALAVVTGIAIWKPVQLAPLTNLLGGYVWARYWHFVVMLCLVLLTVVHVIMV